MSEADGQAGGGKVHHLAAAAALSYLAVALQALINQNSAVLGKFTSL